MVGVSTKFILILWTTIPPPPRALGERGVELGWGIYNMGSVFLGVLHRAQDTRTPTQIIDMRHQPPTRKSGYWFSLYPMDTATRQPVLPISWGGGV